MKTITIIAAILLCFGCATAPQRPNEAALVDAIMNHGMKADQVNQIYADYEKAKAEYEQTASYKSIPYLLAPLLILGGAVGDMPSCGYRGSGCGTGYRGYNGYGGKTVLTTTPIGGGAYQTVIKGYK